MKNLKRIGLVLILALTVCSAFSAQDPSVLLEKAIYTEETLGNLSEAIGIYQQVVTAAEGNHATAALALYRLGMCYQKSGRIEDAKATFAKLSKSYPEQRELISKIPAAASNKLEFRPAPWADGEVLTLSVGVNLNVQKGSSPAGTFTYRFESSRENGKPVWIFKSLMEQGAMGIVQYSTVHADASNLSPLRSSTNIPMMGMRYQVSYSADQVEQSGIKRDGTVTKTHVPINRTVYDQSQLQMLLRCLPLSERYKVSFPAVAPAASFVYDINVSVTDREKVTVPAGIFDCYKVIANQAGQEQTFWISADAHAYIVKSVQSELLTMELNSIQRINKDRPLSFEDQELGITISAPSAWHVSRSSMPTGIHLIEPETEADGMLIVSSEPGSEANDPTAWLDSAVDKYAAGMQKQRQGYSIHPGSRATITASGLPAIRFIADCKHLITGQDTVEYTYLFAKSGKIYRLVLQVAADKFENMKSDFESIADSLSVQ